ncbi:hypothetical protein ONE63_001222 [Megalurothrips usitatus]|uniref:Gustatory receptor n=1 Tax=Megalurothrips usitatus TaxID=439358 RepID=A0AAV7XFL6_9NEOP|nr:hypothetical protein ONE63_001222 [Megalurothrips usitatus]
MRLPLRVGQVFSVMPVDVATGAWSPRRAVYAVLLSCGLSALAASSAAMQLLKEKRVLTDLMVVVFYLLASVMSWLFVQLGRGWATLLGAFRAQERQHGVSPGLRRRLTLITGVLLSLALVEHSLSQMQNISAVLHARPNASGFGEYFEAYYRGQFPMVILVLGYWPVTAPVVMFLNFSATFLWNFTDLFIMLMGVSVASRFKLLQQSVSVASGNTPKLRPPPVLGRAYWRDARRAYNSLSKLVRLVDQALNVQLFVSFLNNLYFICMQLLRGFDARSDPSLTWVARGYVLFSFAFLVGRTSAVSLLVSSVHENSRAMQDVLYCVCSEDYSEEVYRFLVQVTSEMVGFSGLKMFKVTRGLLLTVAGTILTYEVVLVQLN